MDGQAYIGVLPEPRVSNNEESLTSWDVDLPIHNACTCPVDGAHDFPLAPLLWNHCKYHVGNNGIIRDSVRGSIISVPLISNFFHQMCKRTLNCSYLNAKSLEGKEQSNKPHGNALDKIPGENAL